MGRKRRGDDLTIDGDHRGTPFTIRVVDPPLHTQMTRTEVAQIPFVRVAGRTKITTRVLAHVCPATLEVDGLDHPLTFRIGQVRPDEYGAGVGIESLTVHAGGSRISNQSVPLISNLEMLALRLLACRVEVTPRHGDTGGRIVNLNEPIAFDEILIASGNWRESKAGKAITRIDARRQRRQDSEQRRESRGERPHWDDPRTIAALRKVVAKLPPLKARYGQHAYAWVRDQLATEHGLDYEASTVKVMMSKHGLTKKRGKK